MSNRLGAFLKKKLLGRDQNLLSLDDPYQVIARLVAGVPITGILDAGASNGHISRRLLQKFPAARVYAFEPNPLYREALAAYAGADPRFLPQFLALSDHDGVADLHITTSPGNTSLLQPADGLKQMDPAAARVKAVEKVETVTLDGWAARHGNPPLEVMKFDIQGGELQALKGGQNVLTRSTVLVYSEVWFNSLYEGGALFSDLDLLLRDCGFLLYDVFKPRYGQQRQLLWGNALYLKRGVL